MKIKLNFYLSDIEQELQPVFELYDEIKTRLIDLVDRINKDDRLYNKFGGRYSNINSILILLESENEWLFRVRKTFALMKKFGYSFAEVEFTSNDRVLDIPDILQELGEIKFSVDKLYDEIREYNGGQQIMKTTLTIDVDAAQ